ncbi:hypothetical protein KC973_03125 [Candidatus Saccharibacteria bacterium]|nr:hypothetical protein [Candidatus Saccharibacteria bacterium]
MGVEDQMGRVAVESASDETTGDSGREKDAFVVGLFFGLIIGALVASMLVIYFNHRREGQIEVQTVQRELRAYAEMNDIPITEIDVYRDGSNQLMVSWRQDNQTCTVKAVAPKTGDKLWGTEKPKEGSGDCLTKTGSEGVNSPGG